MKFDERNQKSKIKSPLFHFHGNCGKACSTFVKFGVNLTFFTPWLPWQLPPCWIFPPPKVATHYGGYSYKVSWSLMKGIKFFLNPPFCFHGNCGKVCPTDCNFFGLFRSTRCGCCSYQVSSISVRRVICYDHFCVFQFLALWPFPWQRQPFWKFRK